MTNHVHLVVVPEREDSLAARFAHPCPQFLVRMNRAESAWHGDSAGGQQCVAARLVEHDRDLVGIVHAPMRRAGMQLPADLPQERAITESAGLKAVPLLFIANRRIDYERARSSSLRGQTVGR